MEDLLEEIVGDIWDEYDEEEIVLEQPAPDRLICSGRYTIDELNEQFKMHIPDEEFNTIGGFVFGLLGQAPEEGNEVGFEDLTFKVLAVDSLRIDKLEIISPVPFLSDSETLQEDSLLQQSQEQKAQAQKPLLQDNVDLPSGDTTVTIH